MDLYVITDDPWLDLASCATDGTDPEIFFSSKRADEALEICARCPVREECAEYAREQDERVGVWGGQVLGFRIG